MLCDITTRFGVKLLGNENCMMKISLNDLQEKEI